MLSELRLCLADRQYHLNQVDIEDSRELVEKWGSKVPVLCLGDKEICHFFLDNNALHAALVQKL
jgi:thioredoxin reductase (NADPH)